MARRVPGEVHKVSYTTGAHGAAQPSAASDRGRGRGNAAGPGMEILLPLCPNHGPEVMSTECRYAQRPWIHIPTCTGSTEMQASSAHFPWRCMQPHYAKLMVMFSAVTCCISQTASGISCTMLDTSDGETLPGRLNGLPAGLKATMSGVLVAQGLHGCCGLGPWGQVQGRQDFMMCVKDEENEETVVNCTKCHIYFVIIIVITIRNTWKILAGAMEASDRSRRF